MSFTKFFNTLPAGHKPLLREYEHLRQKWQKVKKENKLLCSIIKKHGLEKEVEERKKMEGKVKLD